MLLLKNQLEFGLGVDGDGDRIGAVDEGGPIRLS